MDCDPNIARRAILDHGMEPYMNNTIKEIIACNPDKLVKKMDADDLNYLARFIGGVRDEEGKLDLELTRNQIAEFLKLYPAFCSNKVEDVIRCFTYYFQFHYHGFPTPYSFPSTPFPINLQEFQQIVADNNPNLADVQQQQQAPPQQQQQAPPPQPQNPPPQPQNSTRATTPTTTPTNSSTSISLPNRVAQRK